MLQRWLGWLRRKPKQEPTHKVTSAEDTPSLEHAPVDPIESYDHALMKQWEHEETPPNDAPMLHVQDQSLPAPEVVRPPERPRPRLEPLRAPSTLPPLPREKSDSPLAGMSPLDLLAIAVGQRDMDDESRLRREDELLKRIYVVAFIGPSGTGKSTRAVTIAREQHIDYFIDDGLLIYGSRIVAGTSAKRASTKMESVRQALFSNETRATTMRRALAEQAPDQLMILGTSDGMIDKITKNLHLNPPSRIIRIEDVTTEEERRMAQSIRLTQGQHTIPVPSMEIKHEFSGLWAEPLSRLRSRLRDTRLGSTEVVSDDDRTVVRPTFSTLGAYSISDEAIRSMIRLAGQRVAALASMTDIQVRKESYGVVIDLEIALYYGFEAQSVMSEVQYAVKHTIESLTSMNVILVNVSARKVIHQKHPSHPTPRLETS